MINVLVDTDALLGSVDSGDLLHDRAVLVLEMLVRGSFQLVVGTNILLETATLVSQKVGKQKATELLDDLRSGKYVVVHPDQEWWQQGEQIFREVRSKNISYSDCVSFAIARRLGIQWVFSFDVHFKQQGFKRIGIEGFPKSDAMEA